MDAHKLRITDIFNGNKVLEIPFFQRAYVWEKDQWARFLEDIEDAIQSGTQYFMGPIILKQKPTSSASSSGNVRVVIDGQQRLTTMSILVKVLCLKTQNMMLFDRCFRLINYRPVLWHNHNDVEAYEKIVALNQPLEIDSKDNISRCYQYFLEHLDPEKLDFAKMDASLLFVGIDLDAEDNEQQIFDSINSLGVRLTTAELLKNYFFGREDISEFNTYWRDVFEKDAETKDYWDQEITTGRMKRSFIDQFFFSFLQIKLQDRSLGIPTEKKLAFSKMERLFDSYKELIGTYFQGTKQAILTEIKEYATIFRAVFRPDVVSRDLSSGTPLERLNVIAFALDTTTLMPYILFVEHSSADQVEKDALYTYLESYIMRRLVSRQTTKNYNQLFADRFIYNRIKTEQALRDYLSAQADKINRMPTDEEVEAAFHESVLTNKYATGVLYLIESKIRNPIFHSTQLLGIEKYSLEHLMPKKWQNHWTFTGDGLAAEKRSRLLLTLGNLTIITQNLNASIRDADWETKKAGKGNRGGLKDYADGIEIFSKCLDEPVWDEHTIQARAEKLAAWALRVWPA